MRGRPGAENAVRGGKTGDAHQGRPAACVALPVEKPRGRRGRGRRDIVGPEPHVAGTDVGVRLGAGAENPAHGDQVREPVLLVRFAVRTLAPFVPSLDEDDPGRRGLLDEARRKGQVLGEGRGRALGLDERLGAVPRPRVPARARRHDDRQEVSAGHWEPPGVVLGAGDLRVRDAVAAAGSAGRPVVAGHRVEPHGLEVLQGGARGAAAGDEHLPGAPFARHPVPEGDGLAAARDP